ncbi:MAG: phage baseplate protein, partial [Rhizobacter sp.]|nr:phage baseplate protein [Rhizobacter sp.]
DDLAAQAERVVDDVHTLAGAYGWNETEILAMSAARRALYKQRVWVS